MLTNLIWWILVGLIAGWAAGKIMRGGGYGVAVDIILGIVNSRFERHNTLVRCDYDDVLKLQAFDAMHCGDSQTRLVPLLSSVSFDLIRREVSCLQLRDVAFEHAFRSSDDTDRL